MTSTRAATNWNEKVLHSFNNNGTDGYQPEAGLIRDAAGNLYGTTILGGIYTSCTCPVQPPPAVGVNSNTVPQPPVISQRREQVRWVL